MPPFDAFAQQAKRLDYLGGALTKDADDVIWLTMSIGLRNRVRPYFDQKDREHLPFSHKFSTEGELFQSEIIRHLNALYHDTKEQT